MLHLSVYSRILSNSKDYNNTELHQRKCVVHSGTVTNVKESFVHFLLQIISPTVSLSFVLELWITLYSCQLFIALMPPLPPSLWPQQCACRFASGSSKHDAIIVVTDIDCHRYEQRQTNWINRIRIQRSWHLRSIYELLKSSLSLIFFFAFSFPYFVSYCLPFMIFICHMWNIWEVLMTHQRNGPPNGWSCRGEYNIKMNLGR